MATREIVFELPEDTIAALDALATAEHRSRNELLQEIVQDRMSLAAYHEEMIREGLRQAEAGETVSHDDIKAMIRELTGE